MNETINTADIDECTEINKASNNTGIVLAFLDVVPDLSALLAALFGNDDPVASGDSEASLLCIELGYEDIECLADIRLEVLYFAGLDLCSVDIDINALVRTDNAVLNSACDLNRNRSLVLIRVLISTFTELRSRQAMLRIWSLM